MGDAALLIEFERAEREFVALTVALQERVTSLGAPPGNTEAAQAEQRSLKTELCAAKQLLCDLEISARSTAGPTRIELGARLRGHKETVASLAKHPALAAADDVNASTMDELDRHRESRMCIGMLHDTSGFQSRARRLLRQLTAASGQAREKKAGAAAPSCAIV
jgi:Mg-chelatase subunit ChlI